MRLRTFLIIAALFAAALSSAIVLAPRPAHAVDPRSIPAS